MLAALLLGSGYFTGEQENREMRDTKAQTLRSLIADVAEAANREVLTLREETMKALEVNVDEVGKQIDIVSEEIGKQVGRIDGIMAQHARGLRLGFRLLLAVAAAQAAVGLIQLGMLLSR